MAGEITFSAHLDRGYGKYGRLIGFPKKAVSATVTVDIDSIPAGASSSAVIVVTGALVNNRRNRVVMLPPSTHSTGVQVMDTPISADDSVTVNVVNTLDTTNDPASEAWTALLFSMVP